MVMFRAAMPSSVLLQYFFGMSEFLANTPYTLELRESRSRNYSELGGFTTYFGFLLLLVLSGENAGIA